MKHSSVFDVALLGILLLCFLGTALCSGPTNSTSSVDTTIDQQRKVASDAAAHVAALVFVPAAAAAIGRVIWSNRFKLKLQRVERNEAESGMGSLDSRTRMETEWSESSIDREMEVVNVISKDARGNSHWPNSQTRILRAKEYESIVI